MAWSIDQKSDPRSIRKDIAAIKVLTPQVLHDIVRRCIQIHGALGVSNEMPFGGMWSSDAVIMGLVDGPTEVHRTTVARQGLLKGYQRCSRVFLPSQHLPARRAAAEEKYARVPGARSGELVSLDIAALAGFMDAAGLPGAGLDIETEFVTGGASNDLFSVTATTWWPCASHPRWCHRDATTPWCASTAS